MTIKLGTKNIVGGYIGSSRLCKIYKGSALYMDFCGGGEELWEGCDDGFDYNSYPPYSMLVSTNGSPMWPAYTYNDYSDYTGGEYADAAGGRKTFNIEANWDRHLITLTDYNTFPNGVEGLFKLFDNLGCVTEIIFVGEWPKPIKVLTMAFEGNPLEFLDLTQLTFADDIYYNKCFYDNGDYTCKVTERQKEFIDTTNNHGDGLLSSWFSKYSNPSYIYCGQQYPDEPDIPDNEIDYNSYPPYSVLISTNSDSPRWPMHVYKYYSVIDNPAGDTEINIEANWDRHLLTFTDYNTFPNGIQGLYKMFDSIGNVTEVIFVGEWPEEIKNIGMAFQGNPIEYIDLTQLKFADELYYSSVTSYQTFNCKVTCDQARKIVWYTYPNSLQLFLYFESANLLYPSDCDPYYVPEEPNMYLPIKWVSSRDGDVMRITDKNGRTQNYYYAAFADGKDSETVDIGLLYSIHDGDSISFQNLLGENISTTSIDFLDGDWDKVYVTSMRQAFYKSTNITHIGGLEKLNLSKCTTLWLTFGNTESLLTLDGYQNWNFPSNCELYGVFTRTGLVDIDLSGWADNGASMGLYFMDVNPNLESLNVCGWEGNKLSLDRYDEHPKLNKIYCSDDVLSLFKQYWTDVNWDNVNHVGCYPPYSIIYSTNDLSSSRDKVNVNGFSRTGDELNRNVTDELKTIDRDEITSLSSFVALVSNLTKIEFVGNWDTSKVTNINYMFEGCTSLETIVNLDKLDFSKVTEMQNMFVNTPNLAEIDMSNWRVNKDETIDIAYMFQNKTIDFLDFTAFNGATLTGNGMFQNAHVSRIRCYQSFKDWCYEKYGKTNTFFTYIDEVEWEIVD